MMRESSLFLLDICFLSLSPKPLFRLFIPLDLGLGLFHLVSLDSQRSGLGLGFQWLPFLDLGVVGCNYGVDF